jgi:hypothetical protein
MIRIADVHLVNASVAQVQVKLALLWVGNYNRFISKGQARVLLRASARQENAMPSRGDRRNVLNVENQMWKPFVENARFHFKRSL